MEKESVKDMVNKIKNINLNKLKKTIVPTITTGGTIIVDDYIRLMLFLYPLFLDRNTIIPLFSNKLVLYIIVTLFSGGIYICLAAKKIVKYNKRVRSLDIFLIITALLLILKLVVRCFQMDMDFERETLFLCMIGTYFLVRNIDKGAEYYINLILYSAVILFVGFILYYVNGSENLLGVEIMLERSDVMISYLLLISGISSLLYCIVKEKQLDILYSVIAVAGFLLLFLQNDTLSVCIMGIFLLTIPVIFPPSVNLVKRSLLLCFVFILIIISIPLLPFFNQQIVFSYNIYIDLFLAIVGLFIIRYWKKIPENINPELIILKKFSNWYRKILAVIGMAFTVCILIGKRIFEIPDRFGVRALKKCSASLLQSINGNKSFFQELLENYGVTGCFIWLCIIIMIIKLMAKRWKKGEEVTKILIMVSMLFIVQTFFYQLQPISTPIYVILLTLALFTETAKICETDALMVAENGVDK